MNILIANDDGINAEGIRRLAEALSERADVYIVAPRTQMSAAAHSINHDSVKKQRSKSVSAVSFLKNADIGDSKAVIPLLKKTLDKSYHPAAFERAIGNRVFQPV